MERRAFLIGSLATLPIIIALAGPAEVEQNWSEEIDLLEDTLLALHPGLLRYCSRAQIEHGFELLRTPLPWGMMDNRPFLRCLHGFGLVYGA
jgi:hypothetical protein